MTQFSVISPLAGAHATQASTGIDTKGPSQLASTLSEMGASFAARPTIDDSALHGIPNLMSGGGRFGENASPLMRMLAGSAPSAN
jgi:hypothetical protein